MIRFCRFGRTDHAVPIERVAELLRTGFDDALATLGESADDPVFKGDDFLAQIEVDSDGPVDQMILIHHNHTGNLDSLLPLGTLPPTQLLGTNPPQNRIPKPKYRCSKMRRTVQRIEGSLDLHTRLEPELLRALETVATGSHIRRGNRRGAVGRHRRADHHLRARRSGQVMFSRDIKLDLDYTTAMLYQVAKMDGAIILSANAGKKSQINNKR